MKELIEKLNNREKKMLLILVSLIILYVFYNFVIVNLLNKREVLQRELENLEIIEQNITIQLTKYNSLKNQYREISLEDMRKKLPEKGYVPQVLLWIEEVFNANKLSSPNIQMGIVNNNPSYLQLNLTFNDNYNSVYNLLKVIEDSERIMQIESLYFSGDDNVGSVNLTFRVYGERFE